MPAKKEKTKHLGRGLKSLLGPMDFENTENTSVKKEFEAITNKPADTGNKNESPIKYLPVDQITPNPYQPRTQWDTAKLEELAQSVRANGIIQPIIVRYTAGGYELIAGERRLRASQMAGMDKIPALIKQATDEQMFEIALVENIHRTDLNAIERAKAYQKYIKSFGLSQTEAAEKLGENRSVVANYMRLLDLPDEIKNMVAKNQLSMGHARAILALPNEQLKHKIANKAMAGRLSVREVEKLVRKQLQQDTKEIPKLKTKPAHIIDIEQQIKRQTGTNVNIDLKKNSQRGKITIEFNSLDDFDRISQMLGIDAMATE